MINRLVKRWDTYGLCPCGRYYRAWQGERFFISDSVCRNCGLRKYHFDMVTLAVEVDTPLPKEKWWHRRRYQKGRVLIRLDDDRRTQWLQRAGISLNGGKVVTRGQYFMLKEYEDWYRNNQSLAEATRQKWEKELLPVDAVELKLVMSPGPDDALRLEDVDAKEVLNHRPMDF